MGDVIDGKQRFLARTKDRVRDVMKLAYLAAVELSASTVVEIIVSPAKSKRTLEQNALMWAILTDISKAVQWVVDGVLQYLAPEDWKDLFTAALRQEMRVAQGINGGIVLLGRGTRRMTIKEMSDLIELMNAFVAERSIRLPEHRFIEHWREAA